MIVKRNYARENQMPKGTKAQWFSGIVGFISIHVHNNTQDGTWQYIIRTIRDYVSKQHYNDFDSAYTAMLERLARLLKATLIIVENEIEDR